MGTYEITIDDEMSGDEPVWTAVIYDRITDEPVIDTCGVGANPIEAMRDLFRQWQDARRHAAVEAATS